MSDKIPTAHKFLIDFMIKRKRQILDELTVANICEYGQELTKLHVEAALKAAYDHQQTVRTKKKLNDYDYADSSHYEASKESILSAYPLENIK